MTPFRRHQATARSQRTQQSFTFCNGEYTQLHRSRNLCRRTTHSRYLAPLRTRTVLGRGTLPLRPSCSRLWSSISFTKLMRRPTSPSRTIRTLLERTDSSFYKGSSHPRLRLPSQQPEGLQMGNTCCLSSTRRCWPWESSSSTCRGTVKASWRRGLGKLRTCCTNSTTSLTSLSGKVCSGSRQGCCHRR